MGRTRTPGATPGGVEICVDRDVWVESTPWFGCGWKLLVVQEIRILPGQTQSRKSQDTWVWCVVFFGWGTCSDFSVQCRVRACVFVRVCGCTSLFVSKRNKLVEAHSVDQVGLWSLRFLAPSIHAKLQDLQLSADSSRRTFQTRTSCAFQSGLGMLYNVLAFSAASL